MKRLLILAVVAALFPTMAANGQSAKMKENHFGTGVHAFHAGQLENAKEAFSKAINDGTQDPRVYYFRGLVHNDLGNPSAANDDFKMGAKLEAEPGGRHYRVGRALERVQGVVRMEIETARRQAKVGTSSRSINDELSSADINSEIPLIPDPVAGDEKSRPTNLPDVSGIQHPGTPFAGSSPSPENRSTTPATENKEGMQPTEISPPTEADPFGQPETNEKQSEEDPFGDPTPNAEGTAGEKEVMEADPFGQPAAEEKPAEEDPFGDPLEEEKKPAEEDPFGDPPAKEKEPMEEDPFGEPAAEEDPFGESSEEEKKPTEEDPFGESEPEKEADPTEEDPFGGSEEDPFGEGSEEKEEASEEDPNGEEEGEGPPNDPFENNGSPTP